MLDAIKGKLTAMRAAPVPVNELLETVDDLREQVARLQAEKAAVAAAPRPPEEIIGLLDDRMAALAADALDALHLPGMLYPNSDVTLNVSNSNALLGLLILTNRAALRKLLTSQIEAAASAAPVSPLTEGDRAARLSELDRATLDAELAEESAIRRLEAVGIAVQRRGDANPLAALADDSALPG